MGTKHKPKPQSARKSFAPGSSRGTRNARTLLLQMAMEAERQKEIGARIKELRGRVPQPVIAERVGVTLRAYQAWEAGGGIAWENYGKLAGAFGVDENFIIYGPGGDVRNVSAEERLAALEETLADLHGKVDKILAVVDGVDLADLTEVVTQYFEGELGPNPASGRAGRGNGRQSGATKGEHRAPARGGRQT